MHASWTVMVYLAGFNNLSPFALKDLDEMRKVGSTDEVRIVAFVKRQGAAGAQRLVIERDGRGEDAEELGDVDSGDPQTLLDFVRWAGRVAPAQRYALVVWNHGSGWQPDDMDALYESVRARAGDTGVTPREIGLRSTQQIARSLFSRTVEKVFAMRTSHERAIASDDGTGHSMDTIELNNVLAEAHRELGGPLEVLGMDACLMSNQEVAFQSADHVRYVVGSEDLEPGDGWPYTEIMRRLTADPQMDGAGLGRVIVEEYVRSYSDGTETVTQCAVDVAAMNSFTQPFEQLTRSLQAAVRDRDERGEIMAAQAASVRFQGDLVDVRSFCACLLDGRVAEPVKKAARAVEAALDPVGYVVAEGHNGAPVTGVGGVTVYFPSPFDAVSTHYKDLRFAKESGWDDFLGAYIQAVRNR